MKVLPDGRTIQGVRPASVHPTGGGSARRSWVVWRAGSTGDHADPVAAEPA
ncbi:hypothetical protein FF36_05990 [Frankia torreyi]|uniref:Uncharacterized protein n=1 Tax=Frankia torreyi TaxID=1856 RepID=A0A0D8B6L9_9ACTN|nr:hypothetical protein FF36_05990 [Frankia torreyi]KQM01784.1 hypothetical protein FF86_110811 [Frankia sp. CpI1-P]